MALSAEGGRRPGIHPGLWAAGAVFQVSDIVSRVNGLLFYTNTASASASGPNTCQHRVISCKR